MISAAKVEEEKEEEDDRDEEEDRDEKEDPNRGGIFWLYNIIMTAR